MLHIKFLVYDHFLEPAAMITAPKTRTSSAPPPMVFEKLYVQVLYKI